MGTSEHVPERVLQKIDKTTSAMMESGLYPFYSSFSEFLSEFRMKQILNDDADDAYALTMEHLKIPLVIYLSLISFAFIIFIIELIVYKVKKIYRQRNRTSSY